MERKDQTLGLYVTKTENEAGRLLAALEGGLSVSAMVRRLIRFEAKRRGVWPEGQPQPMATTGQQGAQQYV